MYVGGGVDVVEDGEVVTGIVTRDVAGVEGPSHRLRVLVSLGGDGVGVVWWKDLLVVVFLKKVKEMELYGGVLECVVD